jgi:hypothetical protein
MMNENESLLVEIDTGWRGGPCRVCGQPTTSRQWLYVTERPADPHAPDHDRIVGEAYLHAGNIDCVHPPALALVLGEWERVR